jgi:sec-independent protein translocase protein TatA
VSLGPAEILVILVIALLVFGPHKLPEVGRQVGRTLSEFRKFQDTMKRDLGEVFGDDVSHTSDPPPTLPPKDPEASSRTVSGTDSEQNVAADGASPAAEPGTEAPPDAARSD